jgi:hypothetical protein
MMKEGISPGWQNRLRLAVYRLAQTEIRRLMQILEHTRRVKTTCKTMVLHCVIDMLKTRGTKELKEVIKKEKPRVVWKLNYLSEGTSLIRIGRLLREKDAVNAVPAEAETKAPVVVFEHTSTVRKELLNHKKALRELTEIDWNGERDGPCVCEKYTDKKHKVLKHVITGEFEGMIKSAELRELLANGSGHREPQPVDWEREESEAVDGLEVLIDSWSSREAVMKQGWKEWKEIMKVKIRNRVARMRGTETHVEEILKRKEVIEEIRWLHTHFVLCPVDTAQNNILLVCKKFYQNCLIKEFSSLDSGIVQVEKSQVSIPKKHTNVKGIERKEIEETQDERDAREHREWVENDERDMREQCEAQQQNWDEMMMSEDDGETREDRIAMELYEPEEDEEARTTYKRVFEREKEIVQIIKEKLKKYGIVVDETQMQFAEMYMTGKMHKTVPKMRFLAASFGCVTKTLSALLTKVLRQCYKQHQHLNTLRTNKTGINHLWIADSKEVVLKRLDELNEERKGRNVDTYDFETLYTNIPHKKLKAHICRIIQEAYDSQAIHDNPRLYISTASREGKWVAKPSKSTHTIDCKTAKELVCLLIDNIYVKVGGRNFKQTLGIPMGTDCAPFLANLYLYALESSWIKKMLEEKQFHILQYFKHCFRYIDDLATFNNDGWMERVCEEIYGEMKLNRESEDSGKAAHFLEVDMTVENGYIHTQLYDKRDDFGFKVVTFPTFPTNIPVGSAHGLLIAQVVRYATVCDSLAIFHSRVQTLTHKLLLKGYHKDLRKRRCLSFVETNQALLLKYLTTKDLILRGCFS